MYLRTGTASDGVTPLYNSASPFNPTPVAYTYLAGPFVPSASTVSFKGIYPDYGFATVAAGQSLTVTGTGVDGCGSTPSAANLTAAAANLTLFSFSTGQPVVAYASSLGVVPSASLTATYGATTYQYSASLLFTISGTYYLSLGFANGYVALLPVRARASLPLFLSLTRLTAVAIPGMRLSVLLSPSCVHPCLPYSLSGPFH